jgi:hypothetical protein
MRSLFHLIPLIFFSAIAKCQTRLETIISKWNQQKYNEVIKLGSEFRTTVQGKAIPALDYMILSSICLVSNPRSAICHKVQTLLKDIIPA